MQDDKLPEKLGVRALREDQVKEKTIMTKGNSNKTSNKVMLSQKVKINDESATKDENKSIIHSLLCMCQRKRWIEHHRALAEVPKNLQ